MSAPFHSVCCLAELKSGQNAAFLDIHRFKNSFSRRDARTTSSDAQRRYKIRFVRVEREQQFQVMSQDKREVKNRLFPICILFSCGKIANPHWATWKQYTSGICA